MYMWLHLQFCAGVDKTLIKVCRIYVSASKAIIALYYGHLGSGAHE